MQGFAVQLSDHQFLKKDFAVWAWLVSTVKPSHLTT